jgi:hypothetical protein
MFQSLPGSSLNSATRNLLPLGSVLKLIVGLLALTVISMYLCSGCRLQPGGIKGSWRQVSHAKGKYRYTSIHPHNSNIHVQAVPELRSLFFYEVQAGQFDSSPTSGQTGLL